MVVVVVVVWEDKDSKKAKNRTKCGEMPDGAKSRRIRAMTGWQDCRKVVIRSVAVALSV